MADNPTIKEICLPLYGLAAAIVLASLVTGALPRFSYITVVAGEGILRMFVFDSWTGQLAFCQGGTKTTACGYMYATGDGYLT